MIDSIRVDDLGIGVDPVDLNIGAPSFRNVERYGATVELSQGEEHYVTQVLNGNDGKRYGIIPDFPRITNGYVPSDDRVWPIAAATQLKVLKNSDEQYQESRARMIESMRACAIAHPTAARGLELAYGIPLGTLLG